MKDMFEGSKDASDEVTHHVDRCLSCLSCVTTCPSGVDYMHLVDLARAHIQETRTRPLKERLIRGLLVAVLPDPRRFRLALMGAEQAAGVLATVRRANIEGRGGTWSDEAEAEFKQPIIDQFESQSSPYFASARLWDDGIIDPAETRNVLGLAVSAALNAPIEPTRFGVFRM